MDQNIPKFTHTANMQEVFGIDVDCYVLDVSAGRMRVIGQRGMTAALGLKGTGSTGFKRAMESKSLSEYIGPELRGKIDNPIEFTEISVGPGREFRGYRATILIDVCKAMPDLLMGRY